MTRGKRLLDLALALPLSLAIAPLVAVVHALNRLAGDRGPVLYRGTRIGEHGRRFQVIKLRTMVSGAPGAALTSAADPRVTPVGRLLRRTKLDELPQLWNVVRGEMTLVGPRPEDPTFVDWDDPVHRFVFSARPGITGLAQLAYADEEALHDGSDPDRRYRREILPGKLELDRRYLEARTLRLDARILLATGALVIRRLTGRPRR
jgi:lipopolysaccharide/colanic/teichoic acid biosynthesis glycosyltransferase